MSEFDPHDFDDPEKDPNYIGYQNFVNENPDWEKEHHGKWIAVINGQILQEEGESMMELHNKIKDIHPNDSAYLRQVGIEPPIIDIGGAGLFLEDY